MVIFPVLSIVPVHDIIPFTSNNSTGDIVLIPTLPADVILILSTATSLLKVVFRNENNKSPHSPPVLLVITTPISQQYFRVGKEQ